MFLIILLLIFCGTNAQKSDGCGPIPASLTSPRTGQKAWDKCIEYQERFVYPCEESSTPGASPQRGDHCNNGAPVSHDSDSLENGYSSFVTIGLRNNGTEGDIEWYCVGTIISDRYILTSALCTDHPFTGPMEYVYLGEPVRMKDIDRSKLYKIKASIEHPDYNLSSLYHDISLVETVDLMDLNKHVRPACLYTGEPLNYEEATSFLVKHGRNNSQSHNLAKVKVTRLSKEKCSNEFPGNHYMSQGYVDDWQLCYEDKNLRPEGYLYDAGSSLRVKSDKIKCMDTIIGVNSFWNHSGPEFTVFTRVSHYIPWIESVVWP